MENNEYVKCGGDDERSAQRKAAARRTAERIAQQAYHGMRYYLDRDCGVADIDDDESDYRYIDEDDIDDDESDYCHIDEDILRIFAENCRIRPKQHHPDASAAWDEYVNVINRKTRNAIEDAKITAMYAITESKTAKANDETVIKMLQTVIYRKPFDDPESQLLCFAAEKIYVLDGREYAFDCNLQDYKRKCNSDAYKSAINIWNDAKKGLLKIDPDNVASGCGKDAELQERLKIQQRYFNEWTKKLNHIQARAYFTTLNFIANEAKQHVTDVKNGDVPVPKTESKDSSVKIKVTGKPEDKDWDFKDLRDKL